MKAVVAAFNQEKALVGAFSVITNLRMELYQDCGLVTRNRHQPASDMSVREGSKWTETYSVRDGPYYGLLFLESCFIL